MESSNPVHDGSETDPLGTEHRRRERASPPPDANKRIASLMGETADLEEQKRFAAQLLQSQRMESVGRLASGVAHDINNHLAIIAGYSEGLLRRLPADHPLREYVVQIEKATERGAALTQQLLDFSRGHADEPRPVNINDIVQSVHRLLGHTLPEGIQIVLIASASLSMILADTSHVEQLLMNLAINARDAMPDGGTMTIETANVPSWAQGLTGEALPAKRMVKLAVTDTGSGMDDETCAHIFEPFFTTKDGKGTGLGLWIVHGIVERFNGSINVRSKLGEGTTVELLFPAIA